MFGSWSTLFGRGRFEVLANSHNVEFLKGF